MSKIENKVVQTSPPSPFEQAMEVETLRTECRRTWITAGMLLFFMMVVSVLRVFPQWTKEELREPIQRVFWPFFGLLAVYCLYEVFMRFWLVRLLRLGQALPGRIRYWHVFAEVSLPTFALLLSATMLGPYQALSSSVPYLYFLFIFVTALNLDARLSAFAGLVAGAEFVLVSLLLLGMASDKGVILSTHLPMVTSPHQYVVKGTMLLLSGLLAGFVARRIRRQIESALHVIEERDRAVSIFGQHVSPQVADMLLKQPVRASGEERNVCVLFLDIRDFSRIAGECSPTEVMEYLNQLFGSMIPLVNKHQGIINKFLGDGFMAVFGAPVDDGAQCQHALDAAFDMLEKVDRLNQNSAFPKTRLGIGLHMGKAVTGNVGSNDRKEYTVIGDVVNLASRIEQATKQFGGKLLVSEAVWSNLAPEMKKQAEDIGLAELKGQAKPTRLYKLA